MNDIIALLCRIKIIEAKTIKIEVNSLLVGNQTGRFQQDHEENEKNQ